MITRVKRNLNFINRVIRQVRRDDCLGMAAEIAFQLVLAFIQGLILMTAILSILATNPEVFNSIILFLGSFLPFELFTLIRNQIVEIVQGAKSSILTVSLIGTTWTLSTLMLTLNKSFLRYYNIKETRSFWKLHGIALGLAVLVLFIIAVVLNLLLFGLQIAHFIEHTFGYSNIIALLIRVLRIPVAFTFTTLLAALIYRVIPGVEQKFSEVYPGAVFFTVLWTIFTYCFGYYLRNFPYYNTTYGTLGVGLVLMGWMYLTALSLLIGGEVNAEIHRRRRFLLHK